MSDKKTAVSRYTKALERKDAALDGEIVASKKLFREEATRKDLDEWMKLEDVAQASVKECAELWIEFPDLRPDFTECLKVYRASRATKRKQREVDAEDEKSKLPQKPSLPAKKR